MNSTSTVTTQPNTSSILADSSVFNISLFQTTSSGSTATTSYVDNKFNSILTSNNQFTGQTDITQLIENISTTSIILGKILIYHYDHQITADNMVIFQDLFLRGKTQILKIYKSYIKYKLQKK